MSADAGNYVLQNVECKSLIPNCKISSRSPRFTKRAITNLSDILRRRLCLQQPAPACALTDGCITMPSGSQVANFPTSISFYSCVTMDGNPAFAVHATAHAFIAAINFNSMSLRQHIWCLGNYLIVGGLTNFMLKWIWCDSEGNYDDFYLWDVQINPDYFCKLLIANGQQRWVY